MNATIYSINSLRNLFKWGSTQIEYALFLIMFIMIIFFAFKRAWIALISTIIGLAILAIFVANPVMLIKLAEWVARELTISGK